MKVRDVIEAIERESTYRFPIVIERAGANFSAYAPDLPGCIAVGDTVQETEAGMHEATEFHLESLLEHGEPMPQPNSRVVYHEHAAAGA